MHYVGICPKFEYIILWMIHSHFSYVSKNTYKKNTDAESTYAFLLIPVLQRTRWIMWFNASSSNPSVWNLELKIHLKNLLIFVIWVLFNSLVNSDKLLALQTPTPMATWETQPHYQLRISSCLLYNVSSWSSNPLKILNIFFQHLGLQLTIIFNLQVAKHQS